MPPLEPLAWIRFLNMIGWFKIDILQKGNFYESFMRSNRVNYDVIIDQSFACIHLFADCCFFSDVHLSQLVQHEDLPGVYWGVLSRPSLLRAFRGVPSLLRKQPNHSETPLASGIYIYYIYMSKKRPKLDQKNREFWPKKRVLGVLD